MIAPLFARTPVRPAPKKSGGQANQALGRSRGGISTKIHVTVDGLGNPLRLRLTAGQRHDISQAADLIAGFNFERVIADRGYAAEDFVELVIETNAEPVIPPHPRAKQQRDYDTWLYRERHLVGCTNGYPRKIAWRAM